MITIGTSQIICTSTLSYGGNGKGKTPESKRRGSFYENNTDGIEFNSIVWDRDLENY